MDTRIDLTLKQAYLKANPPLVANNIPMDMLLNKLPDLEFVRANIKNGSLNVIYKDVTTDKRVTFRYALNCIYYTKYTAV